MKALFRRGQARSALGRLLDAQQGAHVIPLFSIRTGRAQIWDADLNSALRLEPNNTSIQDELKKVEQAIAVEKSKACVMFVPDTSMV